MKKYINTSNSTFEDFIRGDFLYVDKTAPLQGLISSRKAQYFISRPRRFGKSLLVSTLKAIFQGKRELFEGLAIDKLDYDWKTYPVIHLNMGSCAGTTVEETKRKLRFLLTSRASEMGIELLEDDESIMLTDLIQKLHLKNGPVVILIDEYDKPLLSHLGQDSVMEIQKLLKNFYGVVKTIEDKLRFALITGVSKFSRVSIFSDLNNLTDLSMHKKAGTMLGYTQEELESNFGEYIGELGEECSMGMKETLEKLKVWYNGYCFHQNSPTVYNPVSVMKCFSELEFKNYWFETATPTFLIELLKKQPVIPSELVLPEVAFSAYDPQKLEVLPLLVQTGYLTIKHVQQRGTRKMFQLGYPNLEIEDSLSLVITTSFAEVTNMTMGLAIEGLLLALEQTNIDALLKHLKVFFAGIPYDIQLENEKYYQSLFFAIFRVLSAEVSAECRTADGRVDAMIKTDKTIFLFEFKLHDTAAAALEQIKAKDYGLAHEDDGREVIKVGVAFDAKTRNLGEWLVER